MILTKYGADWYICDRRGVRVAGPLTKQEAKALMTSRDFTAEFNKMGYARVRELYDAGRFGVYRSTYAKTWLDNYTPPAPKPAVAKPKKKRSRKKVAEE